MFLLSFVKGSKSAEGGPNPLADMDRGGPNPLGHRQKQFIRSSLLLHRFQGSLHVGREF